VLLTFACRSPQEAEVAQEARGVRPLERNAGGTPNGLVLPNRVGSVKFAVIGDSGRGNPPQFEVAERMVEAREHFKFEFVLMNGDNIYEGPATDEDYEQKFARPYRQLLDAGVKFFAVLGNHDDPRQVYYAPFNMNGDRYYTFRPPADPVTKLLTSVRFFAIDTVTLDRGQLQWLEDALNESDSEWKICFFHHPMYTSGRYQRASLAFRTALEPMFRRHGVDVVFSGHEHFYMRSLLQHGIQYFVSGGAGSLRYDDSTRAPFVARDFDTDYHFMLVELERDVMSFQVIARNGETVDSGALYRRKSTVSATSGTGTLALPQSGGRVP
jgi:predicted phosphodiesterase